MSLYAWKRKFYRWYPNTLRSDRSIIHHSLKKWVGLREPNLKQFGVWHPKSETHITDGKNDFEFDGENCTLCINAKFACKNCLFTVNLGCKCDLFHSDIDDTDDEYSGRHPYWVWVKHNNPEPMIAALTYLYEKAKAKILVIPGIDV